MAGRPGKAAEEQSPLLLCGGDPVGTGDRARWAGGAVCAGQRVGHRSLTPGPCREQAVGTGRQPCRQLSSSCGAEPGQAGLGGGRAVRRLTALQDWG